MQKTVFALLAVALLSGCVQQQTIQPAPTAIEQKQMLVVTLKISGLKNTTQVIEVEKGEVLFDVLQRHARIEYRMYGELGALVTAIDGVRQGEGGNQKFWQYYVDGRLASVGVSAYKIEKNETIEFRYEEINPALAE